MNLSSNISNAVGQGLSQLSFDKDFAANRAQRKADQPKSASAGFAQGSKGLAVGVLEGLSGTVEQPMLGFKKSGFKGLAEGLGRGLVGLVTKPSAGFFDLVSSVSAGVGSHVKEREKDRRRFPRQITGDGILRTYNQNEALASLVVASCARAVLQRTARGGRRDAAQRDHYVGHVVSMDIQAGHPLLCIVTQHVFLLVRPSFYVPVCTHSKCLGKPRPLCRERRAGLVCACRGTARGHDCQDQAVSEPRCARQRRAARRATL